VQVSLEPPVGFAILIWIFFVGPSQPCSNIIYICSTARAALPDTIRKPKAHFSLPKENDD
jgi:hypothetical protein